jgi:hypothetical protein
MADLESIDLTNWIVDVLSECTWAIDVGGKLTQQPGSAVGCRAIRAAVKSRRPRRSRSQLELAAEIYRREFHGNPNQAIQDELMVSYRTASRLVQDCRKPEYQLLPPTTKGKRKV